MSCFLVHSVDCEFVAYLFKIRKNSFGHILLNSFEKFEFASFKLAFSVSQWLKW